MSRQSSLQISWLARLTQAREDAGMSRRSDDLVAPLRALDASDFDLENLEGRGDELLLDICESASAQGLVLECAAAMFEVMERLDSSDLGSPGPLVHTLESVGSGYQPYLEVSVRRKPSPLAMWMVNRVLNSNPGDRELWLELLRLSVSHPLAGDAARQEAREFLAFQLQS